MKTLKVLFTGSTQINHIAELVSRNGYHVKAIEKKMGKTGNLIKYYLKYAFELAKSHCVYIVYAQPNKSLELIFARLLGKKVIMHWIGTDVYNCIHNSDSIVCYTGNIHHLAGSPLLHEELKSVGIASDIIPIIPFGIHLDLMNMPERHEALVYLPEGKEEFYRADLIRELAVRNPQVKFHIVANAGYEPLRLENVIFHGRLEIDEMNKLYHEISILVRLPEHDGLSMMVIEALAKGKQVLYKYKHPFVYTPEKFEPGSIDAEFKKILAEEPVVNVQGHEYILEHYNEDAMMDMYKEFDVFS